METNKTEQKSGFLTTTNILIGGAVILLILAYAFRNQLMAMLGMGEAEEEVKVKEGRSQTAPPTGVAAPSVAISPGNYFVSGAAIDKAVQGKFDKWKDMSMGEYNALYGKIDSLFGSGKKNDKDVPWNVSYAQAFFKGMNIKPTPSNAEIFKNEIQEYINNPAHLPNWEVDNKPAGYFLTA